MPRDLDLTAIQGSGMATTPGIREGGTGTDAGVSPVRSYVQQRQYSTVAHRVEDCFRRGDRSAHHKQMLKTQKLCVNFLDDEAERGVPTSPVANLTSMPALQGVTLLSGWLGDCGPGPIHCEF